RARLPGRHRRCGHSRSDSRGRRWPSSCAHSARPAARLSRHGGSDPAHGTARRSATVTARARARRAAAFWAPAGRPKPLGEPREERQHAFAIVRLVGAGATGEGAQSQVLAYRELAKDAAALRYQGQTGLNDLVGWQADQLAVIERHARTGA